MKLRRSMFVAVALVLVLSGLLAGTVAAKDRQSSVRVVHASPDAPAVDVLVNGNVAFSNVTYRTISQYTPLEPGQYRVQVVAAGTQGPAVIDTTLTVQPGTDYTVVAIGRLAEIRALPLVDNNELPAANQAKVRVVHASPNAPAVDVAVAGGPVLFGGLTFGNASDYRTVDAGTVNLQVRPAGTQTVALDLPNVTLSGGTVYTVFAVGLLQGQPPLEALVAVDAAAGTSQATTGN